MIVSNAEFEPEARSAKAQLKEFLVEQGVELVDGRGALDAVDLVVCLGGDGTLLKVCRLIDAWLGFYRGRYRLFS